MYSFGEEGGEEITGEKIPGKLEKVKTYKYRWVLVRFVFYRSLLAINKASGRCLLFMEGLAGGTGMVIIVIALGNPSGWGDFMLFDEEFADLRSQIARSSWK